MLSTTLPSGLRVSRLGFGSMRLPMLTIGDKEYVDVERATEMFHRAFELGVTYVDTGFLYDNEESEFVVGSAIDQWPHKDDLVVTAKCTKFRIARPGDLRRMLEHQLWKQRRSYFDYYLFHGVGWENWHEIDSRSNWIAEMAQAKSEGLVKRVGLSFHDKPEALLQLIDTGLMELVTLQYNYFDRVNEQVIAAAKARGLAVVVMGPVGGGRLAVIPRALKESGSLTTSNAAELALRFVLANPNVDIALSGMSTLEQVKQNCAAVAKGPLSAAEVAQVNELIAANRALADLYCTGCGYCLPCPQGVAIPRVFEAVNYFKVYGMEDHARALYRNLVNSKSDASLCTACNTCLERCPQHIPIPDQQEEARVLFGA
ncbi:MAG: aldo/keto reductase [Anaerolineae bacterium]